MQTLTLNTTTAFLAGVAIVQVIAALKTQKVEANAIGAAVCLIAFMHYNWMRDASDKEKVDLRYGDWFATCPLLVWELFLVTHLSGHGLLTAVVTASALMILLGKLALYSEGHMRYVYFTVSTAILVFLMTTFGKNAQKNKNLVIAFFALWFLYPIAFFLENNNTMFNILDMLSKGVFGLAVASTSF